jgi:hypothetical protein
LNIEINNKKAFYTTYISLFLQDVFWCVELLQAGYFFQPCIIFTAHISALFPLPRVYDVRCLRAFAKKSEARNQESDGLSDGEHFPHLKAFNHWMRILFLHFVSPEAL